MHAFLPRDASGYRIEQTWDILGMRATESNDTILDRAFVADEDVALVCPAGFGGAGLFHVACSRGPCSASATSTPASPSAPTT